MYYPFVSKPQLSLTVSQWQLTRVNTIPQLAFSFVSGYISEKLLDLSKYALLHSFGS